MSNLYRGPSIDASYQVSVHLAGGFQRRRLKCEKLTDERWRTPSDGKSSHCLWQGVLKIFQLYRGSQFNWRRKQEYQEKTTDLSQVADKLYHIMLYQVHIIWAGFKLSTLVVIGTDCIQYRWRHTMINHCDRCITHLSDTDIFYVLFNISSKFLLYLECYLLSPKMHKKVSK